MEDGACYELGPRLKPSLCCTCPRHGSAEGFVGDNISPSNKFIVIKYQPTTEDINARQNDHELFAQYTKKLHLSPGDFGIVNLLRCKSPRDSEPVSSLHKLAKICRKYDNLHAASDGKLISGGLLDFNADSAIITFDYRTAQKAPAFKVFLARAFEWAVDMAGLGHKPLILMGQEVSGMVFPELFSHQEFDRETSFRQWVGHWGMTSWPIHKETEIWKKGEKENINLIEIENAERKRMGWT